MRERRERGGGGKKMVRGERQTEIENNKAERKQTFTIGRQITQPEG